MLGNDLRYTLRALAREPGFAAIAILTLALGIGANTAIFSVVHGVLLRPLPYPSPERLFAIHEQIPAMSHLAPSLPVSAHHFLEWRREWRSFERLAILAPLSMNLTGSGAPERVQAARVSGSLFPLLGVQPRLGRAFRDEEEQPGRDRVALVSDGLWKRRFAGDPAIVGRTVSLDGVAHEVVGVLPADFHPPRNEQLHPFVQMGQRIDIWKPAAFTPNELASLGDFNFGAIARLRPGVGPEQAVAELNSVQSGIAKRMGEKVELRALLIPLERQMTGGVRRGLLLLLAAVGGVLLIGCVNLANLLLARQARRGREMAVRAALGAGRGRLIRHMLTESLTLSLLGGAAGGVLAVLGTRLLTAAAPADLPRLEEVRIDAWVLAFSVALSALTGLLVGLIPALRLSRAQPLDALKSGGRTATEGPRNTRLRGWLVGAEVALSALLLVSAGLLLSSFLRLLRVDKGFDTANVLAADIGLAPSKYSDRALRTETYRRLLDEVRAVPGVKTAGMVTWLPLEGEGSTNLVTLEGTRTPLMERPLTAFRSVDPEFFRAMGIPLRRGRIFEETDRGRGVAVISERMAERVWPGEDALGKRFRLGDESAPLLEVIGVAGDIRAAGLDKTPAFMTYVPYWQRDRLSATLVVRSAIAPLALAAAIGAAVAKVDPEAPLTKVRSMEQVLSQSVAQRRFQMTLVLLFAGSALLLAGLGIYGVVSLTVARRTNEIGIRIALGAETPAVYRMVLIQGLAPVVAGLGVGLGAALALGRVLGSLLFEVKPADPATFAVVAVVLLASALAACLRPAVRAARVDPVVALRYE